MAGLGAEAGVRLPGLSGDLLLEDGLLLQGVPGHRDDVERAPDGDLLEAGLLVVVLLGAVQLRVNTPVDVAPGPRIGGGAQAHAALDPEFVTSHKILRYLE